jgi:diacylglycerol O-acyltransferase / wax synthase
MGEHLTALDATFLELEQVDSSAHMHIGGVMVFDPQPGGGSPPLERIREEFVARLPQLPRWSQRLSTPHTGGLHWPTWEDDPSFDIAQHVFAVHLPDPRGERELLAWAADNYSQRLDRTRPLWEVAISDLADGRWAMTTKTHHCMVDGVGSVDIAQKILDTEPSGVPHAADPAAAEESGEEGRPERVNGAVGLARDLANAGLGLARSGVHLARGALRLGIDTATHPRHAAEGLTRARAMVELLVRDELVPAPRTSLNRPIGTRRRLAVIEVPLDDVKEVKRSLGGTVNDVILAATTSGLRQLLLQRDEPLPGQGLRAMVPVNIRAAGDALAAGNKITSLFVHLPVTEADPAACYAHQMEDAEALKSGTQAIGSSGLIELTGLAPPVLHSFLARSLYATRLFNVTITNVPGPQQPLYAFGSRMRAAWPLVPLAAEHAVGIAVFSYDGRVFFGLNADRDSVPDLDVVADGIENALHDLLEVARGNGASGETAVTDSRTRVSAPPASRSRDAPPNRARR